MNDPRFKANARLMDVVGHELINDDNIAVAELVKNAIDAGARRVDIVFSGANKSGEIINADTGGCIVIADDGRGMDAGDIRDKWLNIAYSDKRERDPGRKFLAGNKGVGRFSSDRLGKRLRLLARKAGKKALSLGINWEEFEVDDKNKEIGGVHLDLREGISAAEFSKGLPEEVSGNRPHGVVLVMKPLRGSWDRKKILVLRRLLEKMINLREELLANRKCEIHVHAEELDAADRASGRASAKNWTPLTRRVDNDILDKLSVEATCAESRVISGGKRIVTEIKDRGRTIAKITESNPYPALKDARMSLYYLNRYKKMMFARKTQTTTLEFGSVFLFLNGFRVPPYGDRGDDWLSLDNRKAQGVSRNIGTRNILGWIEVRDPEGKFQVVSSREGVVQNDAYRQLVDVDRSGPRASYGGYFYDVFGRLESYVVQGLDWDKLRVDVGEQDLDNLAKEGAGNPDIYALSAGERDSRILQALGGIARESGEGQIIKVEIDPSLLEKLREEGRDPDAKAALTHLGKLSEMGALPRDQARAFAKVRRHIEKQAEQIGALRHERDVAEENAAVERSKSMFLERQITSETKGVWGMRHHMVSMIGGLRADIRRVVAELGGNAPSAVRERLFHMRREVDEISTLLRFITNRSFEDAHSDNVADIPEFLRGYAAERGRDKLVGAIPFECDPGLVFASKFSPMDLTMVMNNLVDNARKAAKRGGSGRMPDIWIEASMSKDGKELILRFSDSAGGLDTSIQNPDSIFELGFTTTDGMGMGLHIAQDIVRNKMHGKIRAVPQESGLTFEMRFPKQ